MEIAIENSENVNFSGLDNSMRNCYGNVCFGFGNEVVIDCNEFKNIEAIQKGDVVLSYDNTENTFVKNKVLEVSKNMVSNYFIIKKWDRNKRNLWSSYFNSR